MKNYKTRKLKTPVLIIGLVVVVIGLVGFTYGLTSGKEEVNKQNQMLSINGIDISEEEFKLFLQDEKAATAAYFYQKYGAEDSIDYWDEEYEGEIPIDFARKNAIEKLVRLKVEQELAVESGFLESPVFEKIEKELKKEDSIYGVESLSLYQQYMLYHSKVLIDTLTKFKKDFSGLQEEDLQKHYDDHQFTMFKEADEVRTTQIEVVLTNNDLKDQFLAGIITDLQNDSSINELEEKYKEQYGFTVQEKEYGLQEGKDENSSQLEMQLANEAYTLRVGEVSEPVQYGEQYFIIMVKERNEGGIKDYEEVRGNIENILMEEEFNKVIEDNIQNSQIILNKQKLSDIQMQ